MTCYRVNFFNNLLNSNGQEFKCLQQSLIIREARDEAEALEIAQREFERSECISNWHCHAHIVEVERLSVEPDCVDDISTKPPAVADYKSEPSKSGNGGHGPVILFSLGVTKKGYS
jgi:hypothetical protein